MIIPVDIVLSVLKNDFLEKYPYDPFLYKIYFVRFDMTLYIYIIYKY